MTFKLIIIGYEIKAYNNDFKEEQQDLKYFSGFRHDSRLHFDNTLIKSSVSGNDILQNDLYSLVCDTNKYILSNQNFFIWNFNKYKHYLMHFVNVSLLN